jgi:MtN3 and saliva related transmembrane protein
MDDALLVNFLGSAAGICSMSSFVPQIGKIISQRCAQGVSLKMFAVTVTAFVLWTTYGVLLQSWPIAVSNGVCLLLSLTIVALRLKFGEGA